MSTLDTIKLNIDEKAYSYAKIYASLLKDEYQRKRAYASIVALYAFINLLEETPCDIQNSMTLYRNPILNEQYEITDLYVNKWHLDIRIITEGDAVLVPKVHYEENITPDYYVVIKIDKDLKKAELIGFADTKNEEDEPYDVNYRSIPLSSLINYDEFLNKIRSLKSESLSNDDITFFNENYLGIMDNDIKAETKNALLKLLFNNSELRTEFCCFTGFEMVSCNSSKYDDLFNDNMLGIVGANDVDSPKYEGKEEQIYIGNDEENALKDSTEEQNNEKGEEETEETVSDILDELFGDDGETIAPDTVSEKPVETIVEQTDNIEEYPKDEILSDNILDDGEEFNSLEDGDIELISENDSDNEIKELTDEDITFIENYQENVRPMGAVDYNESVNNEESQKVIVDYDETGEPIYSYITNIDKDNTDLFADVDAEVEEENIITPTESLIEEIPEYENNEKIEEIEETNEIKDSEIIEEEDFNENIVENDGTEISEIEEFKEEKPAETYASEYEYFDDEATDKTPIAEDLKDNILENDTAFEKFDDNKEFETDAEDENMQDKTDETIDADSAEEFIDNPDEEEVGEYEDDELAMPEEQERKSPAKLVAGIIAAVVTLGLIGGGTALYLHSKSGDQISNAPVAENQQQENMFEQNDNEGFNSPEGGDAQDFFGGEGEVPEEQMGDENPPEEQNNPENEQEQNPPEDNGGTQPLTENDLINQNNNPEGDVNKAMVNTFSQGAPSSVSLRELNWFCATELFTDKAFKNYLQNFDNILKQNLKNNFMSATENPQDNTVEAKFAVRRDGELAKVIISKSSGSQEIDDLVLRSINETFEGANRQLLDNTALNSDMYYLKVVIKL